MIIRKNLQPIQVETKWNLCNQHTIGRPTLVNKVEFNVNVDDLPDETINAVLLKADVSPLSPLAAIPMKVNTMQCRYDPQGNAIKAQINAFHMNGNVDLLSRPQVSAADMIAAGYTDFDGDYATLYSMTYTWVSGNTTLGTFLVTPIKENGTVFDQEFMDEYMDTLWATAMSYNIAALLSADQFNLVMHILPGEQIDEMEEIAERAHELSDLWETRETVSVTRQITTGQETTVGELFDFTSVITGNNEYVFQVAQQVDYGYYNSSYHSTSEAGNNVSVEGSSGFVYASYPNDATYRDTCIAIYTKMVHANATREKACSTVTTFVNMELLIYTGADQPEYVSGKVISEINNGGIVSDSICLFDAGEKDFKGNGMAVLHPNSCIVSETAGSNYSLSLEYSLSDERWTLIRPGRLLYVPVPETTTPEFELADVSFWRVKTGRSASVYAKPCISYASSKTTSSSNANLLTTGSDGAFRGTTIETSDDPVERGTDVQVEYAYPVWTPGATYSGGDRVTHNGSTWECGGTSRNTFEGRAWREPGVSSLWHVVGPAEHVYNTTTHKTEEEKKQSTEEIATQIYCTLPSDHIVTVISTVNTFWVYIRTTLDNKTYTGYVQAEFLTEYTSTMPESAKKVAARNIKKQAFRITRVTVDTGSQTLTAEAMHKSYDLQKTMLSGCDLQNVSPAVAIAVIQTSEMGIQDERLIATNISQDRDYENDSKNLVTGDWGWDNALAAFLDSDNGLVAQLHAKLVRDNDDIFILKNETSATPSFVFSARANLHGVRWTIDDSEVVTRIIPKGEDEAGNPLLLSEVFVDAQNANDYSEYRCEILETGYKIGEYCIIDGQSVLLEPGGEFSYYKNQKQRVGTSAGIQSMEGTQVTNATVDELLRAKAQERFDIDHANLIRHTVEVDFTELGDTMEYAPLKALGSARLYDTVRVTIPEIGLDVTTQVNEYQWDCTNPRKPFMRAITLSDAYKENEWPVSGMRIKNGTIKLDKLSRTTKGEFYTYANKVVNKSVSATTTRLESWAYSTFARRSE